MDVEKELQEAKEDVNVGQLIGIIEHLQAESERRNELWGVATAKVAEARQEIEQLQADNAKLDATVHTLQTEHLMDVRALQRHNKTIKQLRERLYTLYCEDAG